MLKRFGKENFFINVSFDEHSASIANGKMGDFEVLPAPMFTAELKDASDEKLSVSSGDAWKKIVLKDRRA